MKKIKLKINGIHCKSCKIIIQDSLEDIGIIDSSFEGDILKISFDENKVNKDKIKQEIEKLGYGVTK